MGNYFCFKSQGFPPGIYNKAMNELAFLGTWDVFGRHLFVFDSIFCCVHSALPLTTPDTRLTELPAFSTVTNTSQAGEDPILTP